MKTTIALLCAAIISAPVVQAATPAALRPDVERLAHACAGCHGTNGHSQTAIPSLANKPADEFLVAMRDFKSGQRVSSVMNRIAAAYADEDFVAMAEFFKKR